MNLLFIGIKPSEGLSKVLLANGISFQSVKRAPTRGDFDIIAFRPKAGHFDELGAIRAHWPLSWLAVVVPEAWLRSATTLPALLERPEKDELWIEETWEHTFWFSVQQALQHRKLKLKVQSLKAERRSLRRQVDELTSHSELLLEQLEKDFTLASSLQRSLLPKSRLDIPGISIAVRYLPAAGLGGDYYDIFEFGDKRRFGIIVADSKTHSMAASLLSVLVKVRLEEMKDRFPDSKSFVEFLSHEVRTTQSKDLAPMSLLYGIFDRATLNFKFTIAGDPKILLWRDGDAPSLPVKSGPAIGGPDDYAFQENEVNLLPGDLLIFYTDGLEEPLSGQAGKKIFEVLQQSPKTLPPQQLQNELMGLIDRYMQKQKLKDDLTLIQLGVDEKMFYLAPKAVPSGKK